MKKIFIGLLFLISVVSYSQIDTVDISEVLNAGNGRRTGSEWIKVNTFMLAVHGTNYFIAASNATATEKSIANVLCDGTADQVQINAAITAGYNVKLSSGQFNIAAPITAAVSNVIIEGTGKEKTTIYQSNGANGNVILIGGNFWTIKNVMLDGNLASNTGTNLCGIRGTATNIILDNVEIKNTEDYGLLMLGACSYWTINNCYLHDMATGINGAENSGGPTNILITNSRFSNTTLESHIQVSVSTQASLNWQIDHCYFSGKSGYVYILFDNVLNCNTTNCYFNGGLEDAGGMHTSLRYYKGASGIISGNTFVGATTGTGTVFTSLHLWGADNTVVSNNFFGSRRGIGMVIEAVTTGGNVSNINVTGNVFYNISTLSIASDTCPAISITPATTYTIENINIINNSIKDDRGVNAVCTYGVLVGGAGTVKKVNISNNMIEGLRTDGIKLEATTIENVTITNNQIIDLRNGIVADEGNDIVISGNSFSVCITPIDVNDADVTRPLVTENTMYGCTNSGTYAGATGESFGLNLWHDGTYDNTAP